MMSVILSVTAVIVGAAPYPAPVLVIITSWIEPFSTVQIALAPPPPRTGVISIVGAVEYPTPPSKTVMD